MYKRVDCITLISTIIAEPSFVVSIKFQNVLHDTRDIQYSWKFSINVRVLSQATASFEPHFQTYNMTHSSHIAASRELCLLKSFM